jgi:hypothetical protein
MTDNIFGVALIGMVTVVVLAFVAAEWAMF